MLEDKIYGPEVSVFSFTDGINFSTPIAICDYKRVHDNDIGPNTGGMGCYTPPEFWHEKLSDQIICKIISPTLNSMNKNQASDIVKEFYLSSFTWANVSIKNR